MLNGVSEKQIAYAKSVRADALNALGRRMAIYQESSDTMSQNLVRFYTVALEMIRAYTEARDVLDHAQKIAEETKTIEYDYHTCYDAVKARYGKKLSMRKFLANYTKPVAYFKAEMFAKQDA